MVLRCGRLDGEIGDLDGEFGAEEEGEVEEAGPGEGGMAAGEGFEGVVDEVRVWVLADIGVNESPSGIKALAVATHDVLLDVVEIGLAAGDTAGSRFAEEVLHALCDEE